YPSGSCTAIPVLITFVSFGRIITSSLTYRSNPESDAWAFVGIIASLVNRLNPTLIGLVIYFSSQLRVIYLFTLHQVYYMNTLPYLFMKITLCLSYSCLNIVPLSLINKVAKKLTSI